MIIKRGPATAERPRDASVSASIVSFSTRYHTSSACNLLLLVTSASDLPLRTQINSVLFSSSWSSMLVVINEIH